jgi:PKD repeat protein
LGAAAKRSGYPQQKLILIFQSFFMKKVLPIIGLCLIASIVSIAQSANWSAVLPALFPTNASGQIHGISRISQMKFHPSDPNKMYAVSARGGLFISTNGGSNWTVTPGTDFMASNRLASVCIDFTNDQVLYLGTGDHNYYYSGNGVMKSTNGGQTFTPAGLSGNLVIEMIMDPLDHNTIVAVTNTGIYKTTNGATTWTLKSASRPFDDLKHKYSNSRTLYAATADSAFLRSTDFGDTWTQITSGIVLPSGITNGNGCRIAVTPADSNVVYLGMTANSGLIYKSTNGGTSFTAMKTSASPYLTYYDNLSSSSGQGDYNFSIGVDRTNASIVYLVAHNVWKSTNSGTSWTQLTNWWAKVHTDMHQIFTSPYDNTKLYDVNDGGVWLSTDGGNNWVAKSDGIYGYEIYHGNCSPKRKDMFSIGTQDNGELYATSAGWFTNRGGDWGSPCYFDYRTNSSMVYYLDNNKRRLVNGSDATYGLPVASLSDITFHRSNADLAFAANTEVYRTTNLTASTPSWTQITSVAKSIKAVHSSFADPNRLYFITSDNYIYVSTNAQAASPTFTSYPLPGSSNNSATITTIRSNANVIYITANTQVYRSADNGATWTNIKYNLPSVNHIRILADEYFSGSELVVIASNNAVYYKTGSATTWTIYSDFLPSRTYINDMSIFNDSTSNTSLRVSTYGRGMWETPINNLRALTANFSADNTNPCPGQSVQFSDLSTGNVSSRSWSFPGGTPSSSTLQNPLVQYNTPGSYNVSLTVTNGAGNDTKTATNYITTTGGSLPLAEDFEGALDPPAGWKNVDNGTLGDQWMKTAAAGGYGASTNSMMFDNYSWNVPGQKDELIVKRLDLSGYTTAKLFFDVAYQVYNGYADSLNVLVSTDCGATYTSVYSKGGATLSTAGSGANNFVPSAAQWRTDTVNLTPYVGSTGVLIAFQNVNGYGNKLYLDNVNITAVAPFANAGPDQTICAGNSVTIGIAPVSGVTYSWSPATGLSNPNISNPFASPASTTSYILTATQTISGIVSKDTVIVNVSPLPAVTIGSYPNQCSNGPSITLTGSPSGGSFSGPGVTGNSFSPAAAGLGSKVIVYSYTNGSGCTNTAQTTITVITCCAGLPNKPGAITQYGGAVKVCPGETRSYSFNPVSGATSYTWTIPAGVTVQSGLNTNNLTVLFSASMASSVVLNVVANNACGSGPAQSKTVNRGTTPGLPSAIAGQNFGICGVNPQSYSVTSVAGMTYAWSINSIYGTIQSGQGTSSIQANFTPAFVSGTMYVSASNGCGTSGLRSLLVNAPPAKPQVINGLAIVCPAQSYSYSVAPITGAATYTWKAPAGSVISDGTNSATATLVTASASVTVTYGNTLGPVKVRANNSCGSSAYATLNIIFDCNARMSNAKEFITIIPNPATDNLVVRYYAAQAEGFVLSVRNSLGQEVISRQETAEKGTNGLRLEISRLAAGIYELSINGSTINYNTRFIKE